TARCRPRPGRHDQLDLSVVQARRPTHRRRAGHSIHGYFFSRRGGVRKFSVLSSQFSVAHRRDAACRVSRLVQRRRGKPRLYRITQSSLLASRLRRHPIHFFLQVFFLEADPLQDALTVLDHLRMPAQIRDTIRSGAPPLVGVLANQFVHAADLALPTLVLPRTTHRENTAKPWRLFREVLQLRAITELPRPARPVQKK